MVKGQIVQLHTADVSLGVSYDKILRGSVQKGAVLWVVGGRNGSQMGVVHKSHV